MTISDIRHFGNLTKIYKTYDKFWRILIVGLRKKSKTMAGKTLTSIIGGKAITYIFTEQPSLFVPFEGNFPLAKEYQREVIMNEVCGTHYFEDIEEEWIKDLIKKGAQMYDIDQGFKAFLGSRTRIYNALPESEKAEILAEFMDKNCLDIGALRI